MFPDTTPPESVVRDSQSQIAGCRSLVCGQPKVSVRARVREFRREVGPTAVRGDCGGREWRTLATWGSSGKSLNTLCRTRNAESRSSRRFVKTGLPQPVSNQARPVSPCWRALPVSHTYRGICDNWRCSWRRNRVTPWGAQTGPKSAKIVSESQADVIRPERITRWTSQPSTALRLHPVFWFELECQ